MSELDELIGCRVRHIATHKFNVGREGYVVGVTATGRLSVRWDKERNLSAVPRDFLEVIYTADNRRDALEAENKRLREALEQVKSGFCSHNVDGVAVWCRNCQEKVNISREALKGEE